MTNTIRDAIQQCMMEFEVDVSLEELISYCYAATGDIALENNSQAVIAELSNMLENDEIVWIAETNSFDRG